MKTWIPLALISTVLTMASAAVEEKGTRSISGTITSIKNPTFVVAVEVNTGKHINGKIEPSGKFTVSGLLDGTYFIMAKSASDVVEGLRFPDDLYAGKPLTDEDKAKIEKAIRKTEEFFNEKEIWRMEGGQQKVIAFVKHERTKDWFLNAGDHITDKIARRLDFFVFRRAGEEWKLMQYYMLIREELPNTSPPVWQHHHADSLGGIELSLKHPQAVVKD